VKALSSPTAERLKKLQAPRRVRIPAVPQVKAPAAPLVKVKDIIRDPTAVVQQLDGLQVSPEVLADAHTLVDTLTDPQKLLQALADPQSLLQGLTDPTAALDALSMAVNTSTNDQSAPDQQTGTAAQQQVDAVINVLRKVARL